MRWVLACLVIASCAKPPPPKPAAAELEVTGPASFAGSWVTDDELDRGYTLVIDPAGALLLTIDRGKMGKCEQKGTLVTDGNPRWYRIVYTKNTCNPDYGGTPLEIKIASFTGTELALVITGDGAERRPVYTRDPKSAE
ncbi:MAG: hypothetical protein H0T42_33885 [Deltaproteobacteria bacterium]|nr:hypothetical protein [Deltaproteobacteria bacterium]